MAYENEELGAVVDAAITAREARHSSETNEHYTPVDVLERARRVLGYIDVDPASCAKANTLVRADTIYTIEDSGLTKQWHGNVWLNPPGGCLDKNDKPVKNGRSSARRWWEKLVEEYEAGRAVSALFLGFNLDVLQTTQGSPRSIMEFSFCIPITRTRFLESESLKEQTQPTHANVIVFLPNLELPPGQHTRLFLDEFKPLGRCKV